MFKAIVIRPEERKRRVKCYACDLSYTARNYKILFIEKKLIYFKFKRRNLCHDCLLKTVAKETPLSLKKISLEITDGEVIYECAFYPEYYERGNSSDAFPDFPPL
jgi:hypothetical protein